MQRRLFENASPSAADYTVIIFSLILSVATGFYHAFRNHFLVRSNRLRSTQKDEYMLGGRRLPLIPVALSLLTTFLSGILMLGVPAEIVQRGTHIWLNFVIGALSMAIAAWIFLPIFHKIRATCIHEYFIHRYHSEVLRQAFSVLFLLLNLTYIAVVIYAPCVALSPVLGINKYILILISFIQNTVNGDFSYSSKIFTLIGFTLLLEFSLSTTLYTTIGGIRAVVWTDSLQALLMYGGVLAVICKSVMHPRVGGVEEVWSIAKSSGRIDDLWHYNITPAQVRQFIRFINASYQSAFLQYNSFWINIISGTVTWLATFGVNQLAVQRYCSLPTIHDTRRAISWIIVPFILICSLVSFIGLIALKYFYNCNPLEAGYIKNPDHLIILFAVEVLTSTPGMFGLFVACIMSATLSTSSSGINSLAAAVYEDFIKRRYASKLNDRQSTIINKASVLIFGILSTALAFATEPLGGILRVCISVFGALSGPFVGIFVLAIFWPKSGFKSTFVSFILTNVIMITICCYNYFEDPYKELFLNTNSTKEGCNDSNFTMPMQPFYEAHYGNPNTSYIARISTYAYSGIGMLVMLILGILLSYLFCETPLPGIKPLTFAGRELPFVPVSTEDQNQGIELVVTESNHSE
uniref:Sodium-coupled monocarboxylate transporter 1 n=1 Tax=Syphacia muris TaxID=451379 RepID=A0A158R3T4_9BILA